jgi:hypothetical protein
MVFTEGRMTIFHLKTWYFDKEDMDTLPNWWLNFISKIPYYNFKKELEPYASFTPIDHEMYEIVFHSPELMTFFILRWA